MDNLSIYHPRVIATARFLGITELQALRHERARRFLQRFQRRNRDMILQTRIDD